MGLLTILALWPPSNAEKVVEVLPELPPVSSPLKAQESPLSVSPPSNESEQETGEKGIGISSSSESNPPKPPQADSGAVPEKGGGVTKQIGPGKSPTSKKTRPSISESEPPPSTVAIPPSPNTSGSLKMEEIRLLMNRLKTAYSKKDLYAIKKDLVLSDDQELLLKEIFNSYKTIQSDIEPAKVMPDRITGAILITSLENETGNVVIPSPRWGRQILRIESSDHPRERVKLDPNDFKGSRSGPVDVIAPAIFHSLPQYTATPGKPTMVSAMITDNVQVASATLRFRAQGAHNFESIRMVEGPPRIYTAPIPASMIKADSTSMEYYIEARDTEGNLSLEGRPSVPLVIAVVPPRSE